MQATTVSVIEVFNKRMQLDIPRYQRQYVWNENTQWQPLWEDLERKFSEYIAGKTDTPPHFLGAVVIDQQQTPISSIEKRSVIDGQQRMTTFQIILIAMRNYARTIGSTRVTSEVECSLLNMNANGDEKFKLSPTINDKAIFCEISNCQSHDEIERLHPLTKKSSRAKKYDPRHQIIEAYFYFYNKIKSYTEEIITDSEIEMEEKSEEIILLTCYNALRSGLKIVSIDLDKNDDPQVIFETLNARGEPLLPADLLRNFIFLRAARNNENQDQIYNELWKELELSFWKEESNQGRSLRPRSDIFIQHYLTAQTGKDVSIKHLYVEYKYWASKTTQFKNIYSEVEYLIKYAKSFKSLWENGSKYSWFGEFVSAFEVSTCIPLAIKIINETPGESTEILRLIESYIVRRSICGLTPKNYNKVFSGAIRACIENGSNLQTLKKYFVELKGETVLFPDNNMLEAKWMGISAYQSLSTGKIAHIMKSINAKFIGVKTENIQTDFAPSIEHILPQTWETNWLLPNGEKGYGRHDYEKLNSNDEISILSKKRHGAIHLFGNLTLVTTPLNSSLSNLPWEKKKEELMKHSILPINTTLALKNAWTEDDIEIRTSELLDHAKLIWKNI